MHLSIRIARTPETVEMLDAVRLAQIPDNYFLANATRANIVVENAHLWELRTDRLSAVLNFYHEESFLRRDEIRYSDNIC